MGCTADQIRERGSALVHQCNAADGDDSVALWPQFSRDAATGSGPDLNTAAQAGSLMRDLPEKKEFIYPVRSSKSITEERECAEKEEVR